MLNELPLFPEAASSMAREVDFLYIAWVGISLFFSLLIAILVIFFFMKYRRREGVEAQPLEVSTTPIEIAWSLIPLVITLVMFAWGAKVFLDLSIPPANAVDYYAVGKQWMWKFQHPHGVREINNLHVPVGQPIRVTLTSQDVIHSLYIPAFRVKADVLPGQYTTVWFEPTRPGVYHLFCAEYCGSEHSKMGGKVYVLEQKDYDNWLATGRTGPTMQASGEELFRQLACDTCHRPEGAQAQGLVARAPQLEGLFGTQVQLMSGRTVTVDENYLRNSILDPQADVVAGWQPIMPTYRGQVTEEQLNELVAYVKSLATPDAEAEVAGTAAAVGTPGQAGDEEGTER